MINKNKKLAYIIILNVLFINSILFSNYERKNIVMNLGEKLTITLKEGPSEKWETRVVDKDMIKVIEQNRTNKRFEIILQMVKKGLARFEAVLISKRMVKKRVYYFIKVNENKKDDKKTKKKSIDNKDNQLDTKKKKELSVRRDLNFAIKLFDMGYYTDAARALRLFRKKHKASSYDGESYLYEARSKYENKLYTSSVALLKQALKTSDQRIKFLAHLWMGYSYLAMNMDDNTLNSFLSALTGLSYPDVDIQARTGLALYYARNKRFKMARKQFEFLKGYKSKDISYVLALFYAGRFFDSYQGVRDIDKAYSYYKKFLKLSADILLKSQMSSRIVSQLKKHRKRAEKQASFLKRNFIDYR